MIKKKTIIVVSDSLGHGGLQKMASFVAGSCLNSFNKVYLVALSQSETKQDIEDSIIVKKLNYIRTNSHVKNVINMLKTSLELRNLIKSINPDIICSMGTIALFVTIIAKLFTKIKLVGSERNSPVYYSGLWKILNTFMFKLCDGLIFQTKEAMEYHGEIIASKSFVIPNPYIRRGMQLDAFKGERDKVITTAAARFEYKKGIDILINAFAEINRKHPQYRLVIYGQGGLYDDYVIQTKKLGIDKYVDFPGMTSDVATAVHKSSVFVLPSRFEGIPNVLMEVMGGGVPTVSTDCHPGGPRLLTNNGRYGILVPVENVDAMVTAICYLIENQVISEKLGQDGKNYIHTFSKENISKMWVEYFRKIMSN